MRREWASQDRHDMDAPRFETALRNVVARINTKGEHKAFKSVQKRKFYRGTCEIR
jgi:hypothetical protein